MKHIHHVFDLPLSVSLSDIVVVILLNRVTDLILPKRREEVCSHIPSGTIIFALPSSFPFISAAIFSKSVFPPNSWFEPFDGIPGYVPVLDYDGPFFLTTALS